MNTAIPSQVLHVYCGVMMLQGNLCELLRTWQALGFETGKDANKDFVITITRRR